MRRIALLAVIAVSLASCNRGTSSELSSEEVVYACPMECEEDKTYSEPGTCPVCGMNLKEQVSHSASHSTH